MNPTSINGARLDAAESVFFARQLESIDQVAYQHKYPKYKARMFLPNQQGVGAYDRTYTYRMYDTQGRARPMGNNARDIPLANASGAETSQVIHNLEVGYAFNLMEIQQAAKTGTALDQMRANAAKRAMDELIDEYLSLGNTTLGVSGLLKLTGTSTYTSAGFWGTLATADPDKVAGDLLGTLSKGVEATDEAFSKFVCVLPLAMYNIAAQLKMSSTSNVTVLDYVSTVCPYLEGGKDGIQPWYRTELAVDSTHDLICAFPRDPECVAALVPRDLEFLAPQQDGFNFVRPGHAACGGVVVRYPKAITYCSVVTS